MVEQRQLERRHLHYYLDVVDRATGQAIGRLGDLSEKGLLLLCDHPVQRGDRYEVELDLSRVRGLEAETFVAKAVVRWSGADQNPAIACAGLEFEQIDPELQSVTDLLIKFIGFRDA